MILSIETSTPVCSIALRVEGKRVWEKRIEGRGVHSERLFTFTQELLERAGIGVKDLDGILFSRGPGSYTGLRIGASAIKGLLYGHNSVPLYTFPTLFAFAAGLKTEENFCEIFSVIDARRTHLYVQQFERRGDLIKPLTDAGVEELSAIEKQIPDKAVIVGTGWERLKLDEDKKVTKVGSEGISAVNLISAFENKSLKPLFRKESPEQFEPDYLELAQLNNSNFQR